MCIAVIAFAALLSGCGGSDAPSVAPVTGVVTYQGKPVAGATVNFIKEGAPRSGVGITNAEGRFQISTFANNDGAIIGDHVVTVVKKAVTADLAQPTATGATPEDMMKRMRAEAEKPAEKVKTDELPVKYANPTVSGLKAIVSPEASKNDFRFELVD